MELTTRKKIIYTAVVVVSFIGAAELAVRLGCWAIGRVPYTAATPWMVADDELLYVFRPNYEGKVYLVQSRINNHGLRDDDFTTRKPKGTRRVLCLGDSRTFGYLVDQDEAYPSQLERLLRERYPSGRIEVLNAGRPAYSIYQGLRYLELRGLQFEPDVVTVGFGSNGRRFVLRREQADSAEWFRHVARDLRLRHQVRFSYALLALSKVLRRVIGVDTWSRDVLALPSQRLDNLPCRVEGDTLRRRLRQLVRLCHERRIPVVILIMADAPSIEQAFDDGMQLRSQEQYDEAVEAFARIGRDPADPATEQWYRALVHYEIGLTREAEGRTSEALATFRESAQAAAVWSISGGTAVRHGRDYLKILREVAEELKVPRVEIAERFARRPELFTDHCHFTAEGHRLIAEAVAECLAEHRLLEPVSKP